MTQPAKAQEPTMEEILASIRRIIADEESAKPQDQPGAPGAAPGGAAAASSVPERSGSPVLRPVERVDEDGSGDVRPLSTAEEISERVYEPSIPDRTAAISAIDSADDDFSDIDGHANENFDDGPLAAPSAPRSPAGHLRAIEGPASLLSAEATAAVNSAFGTLAHTVLVQNARTLEDLVKEMLRPMLKTWLDDNLPNLVERLVRAEIERVSRGHPG